MYKNLLLIIAISSASITAISQSSDSSAYYFQKGTEFQAARKFREAEKSFLKADQFKSNQANILTALASSYLSQNRYGEAKAQLIKADLAAPDNQDVIFQLAELSLSLRQWPD